MARTTIAIQMDRPVSCLAIAYNTLLIIVGQHCIDFNDGNGSSTYTSPKGLTRRSSGGKK